MVKTAWETTSSFRVGVHPFATCGSLDGWENRPLSAHCLLMTLLKWETCWPGIPMETSPTGPSPNSWGLAGTKQSIWRSTDGWEADGEVLFSGQPLKKVEQSQYLGSVFTVMGLLMISTTELLSLNIFWLSDISVVKVKSHFYNVKWQIRKLNWSPLIIGLSPIQSVLV